MNSVFRLLLACALAASLSACSEDEPEAAAPAPDAPVEQATAPVPPAPVAPAEPPQGQVSANGPIVDSRVVGALDHFLAHPLRGPRNPARDIYRHPKETLSFFGLQAAMTVIEITPGDGWYFEIISPAVKGYGQYIAAVPDRRLDIAADVRQQVRHLEGRIRVQPKYFGGSRLQPFDPAKPNFGPPNSADMVLTFRNAHNWIEDGTAPAYFQAIASVLKSGGVLGLVAHRAPEGPATDGKLGYVTEEQIIELAIGAGLQLAEKSEINANPEDTRDYPDGVWTLPPTLALGEQDRTKYLEIGESDRMTLKFLKP